jgi:hypothetical protein
LRVCACGLRDAGLALARQRGQKQACRDPARITATPVSWFSACA